MSNEHRAHVVRETIISGLINGAISAGFFLAVFGGLETVPTGGLHGYAADFLPQALAVGFMASLMPGFLTRRRVRQGSLKPDPKSTNVGVLIRAVLIAIGSVVIFGGGAAACASFLAPVSVDYVSAFIIKVAYGVFLGMIATPIAVRGALRSQATPRGV